MGMSITIITTRQFDSNIQGNEAEGKHLVWQAGKIKKSNKPQTNEESFL